MSIKSLMFKVVCLLPIKEGIVLESHPDFSDNSYAIYRELIKRGYNKNHPIYWMVHDMTTEDDMDLPENVERIPLDGGTFSMKIKRLLVLYRTRCICDCNRYIYKRRDGQLRIHLGHGMPIKYVKSYTNLEQIGDVDYYLMFGKYWMDFYHGTIGIPEEKLLPIGYPRNDELKGDSESDERYIIWMPTYRQHKKNGPATETRFPYGMPEVENEGDLKALNACLEKLGVKMLFRPHPAQDLGVFERVKLSNVVVADDEYLKARGKSLYSVVRDSLALITDYSSIYFDYLVTGKPIGLTLGDAREFFEHNTCVFEDVRESLAGWKIDGMRDLLDFIQAVSEGGEKIDAVLRDVEDARNIFLDQQDRPTTEIVLDYLNID
ncbi:MAG: CDP-glycerol glycerophosphotransferase family protein [Eubacterium sp.]|nr:CDP-glycerol glycerophosphotransferase family protein [Eubacterium sp.]